MCNLYSITTNQAAIIGLFPVMNRYVGNLPPMPGVFPDYPGPVIRQSEGGREMVLVRLARVGRRTGLARRRDCTDAVDQPLETRRRRQPAL
jgi:hypothetical protein